MRRLSLFAPVGALVAIALAPAVARAQTTCDPARVLVLFDRSTSMYDILSGSNSNKWSLATSALTGVLQDFEHKAEFGLALFPQAQSDCSLGADMAGSVLPKLDAFTAIKGKLDTSSPFAQNGYTPIGQAIVEAGNQDNMKDTTKRRYVILFTDGVQDCPSSADIWSTTTLAAKVKANKDKGIKTFVIGFGSTSSGDGVRAYSLNQMAWNGGVARAGCNKDGSNPQADDLCYYQADNSADLEAAFEEIAVQISEETCDGKDNNCNGQIDENLFQDCSTACGTGTQQCTAGMWGTCSATAPQTEVCDDKDNDCDGMVDEGCACRTGETQQCGKDTGECEFGHQDCVNGQWGACVGGKGPTAEICDGLDNNCDGFTDPDCDCQNGQTDVCGGPNVGQCKTGLKHCMAGGWGDCIGAVGPSPEVCDGIDNDCDGVVDEGSVGEDDDLSNNLCDADHICQNGQCVLGNPFEKPPVAVTPNGEPAGCACRTGGGTGTSPLGGLFLAAALAAVFLRRRAK